MYRMAGLLSTLPVGKDMEQLFNYYFSNMQMSASVRRYIHSLISVILTSNTAHHCTALDVTLISHRMV